LDKWTEADVAWVGNNLRNIIQTGNYNELVKIVKRFLKSRKEGGGMPVERILNRMDNERNTAALHLAAEKGNIDMVKHLVSMYDVMSISKKTKDNNNKTALQLVEDKFETAPTIELMQISGLLYEED